jgi:hypothetical protein
MESDWGRPYYKTGGGDPFVLFTVFGQMPEPFAISAARHHATEIPAGVELRKLDAPKAAAFFSPPLGPTLLADWDGDSPDELAANGCVLLRGQVTDPADLRYLRNSIGIVTALLEGGGKAALNPQALLLFSPERWRSHIFEADKPHPRHHVAILYSQEPRPGPAGRLWVHTRGLRLFGRPDISIRDVPSNELTLAVELCNRFIEMLAFGEVVSEGQPVRVSGLPDGMICRRRGDLEDPDFNNVHVEMIWPAQ